MHYVYIAIQVHHRWSDVIEAVSGTGLSYRLHSFTRYMSDICTCMKVCQLLTYISFDFKTHALCLET